MTKEETLELLEKFKDIDFSKVKFPRHTKKCYTIMVGGLLDPARPFNSNHEVWICDDKCPLKNKESL